MCQPRAEGCLRGADRERVGAGDARHARESSALGGATQLLIDSIDGEKSVGEWRAGLPRPLLQPGAHEVVVRRLEQINGGGGLIGAMVNLNEEAKSKRARHRIRFDAHAGYAYQLHISGAPQRFFVTRVPIERGDEEPPLDPPWAAVECPPAEASAEDDVPLLVCPDAINQAPEA